MKKNEIVLFETADNEVSLQVQMQDETVWLTRNQMATRELQVRCFCISWTRTMPCLQKAQNEQQIFTGSVDDHDC